MDYKIKHNKLNIYAITSRKYTMTIDNTLIGLNNEEISCEALNWAENCNIKLPSYEDFDNLEFNTKNDNTGYKFFEDEKYTLLVCSSVIINPFFCLVVHCNSISCDSAKKSALYRNRNLMRLLLYLPRCLVLS